MNFYYIFEIRTKGYYIFEGREKKRFFQSICNLLIVSTLGSTSPQKDSEVNFTTIKNIKIHHRKNTDKLYYTLA